MYISLRKKVNQNTYALQILTDVRKHISMMEYNPEREIELVPPPLDQVLDAYGSVLEHNSKLTGMGGLMAKIAIGLSKDESVQSSILDFSQDAKTSQELQEIVYGDLFTRIGITLVPVGQAITNSIGQETTGKKLVPMIDNLTLFKEFVQSVESLDISSSTEKFFADIIDSLIFQSKFVLVAATKSDERLQQIFAETGEDALRRFADLEPEFERLGLDDASLQARLLSCSKELNEHLENLDGARPSPEVKQELEERRNIKRRLAQYKSMKNRVDYWGRNVLTEYIIAEQSELLTPPSEQGFGPYRWHTDGGQYLWKQTIEFVNRLEADERTKQFAQEVKASLVDSLDAAISEIKSSSSQRYYFDQLVDLKNLRNYLADSPYEKSRLEVYIQS